MVRWKGMSEHDCTWEWKLTIKNQYPELDLEDKVGFEGEGNVTHGELRPQILYQYQRKGRRLQ